MRSNQQVESRNEPRVRPEPTQRSNPFGERESARILRLKQVSAIVGIGRSSIYRKVQEGTFPSPIKLGSARASGWISGDVYEWIDEQIRRCRKGVSRALDSRASRDDLDDVSRRRSRGRSRSKRV